MHQPIIENMKTFLYSLKFQENIAVKEEESLENVKVTWTYSSSSQHMDEVRVTCVNLSRYFEFYDDFYI